MIGQGQWQNRASCFNGRLQQGGMKTQQMRTISCSSLGEYRNIMVCVE